MPPVVYKPPKPVFFRVPIGEIPILANPIVQMGKTLVAQQPLRIKASHLEEARKMLRRQFGKNLEIRMNVHATYSVSQRPMGTKQGQGKGPHHHFVARVPAGTPIFQIPSITALPSLMRPEWTAFRAIAHSLPAKLQFRDQTNLFKFDVDRMKIPASIQQRNFQKGIC